MHVRPLAIAGSATIAALSMTGAASAATVTPDRPCYTYAPGANLIQPVGLAISGGTPNATFQVYGPNGKTGSATGTFDSAGNANASITSFNTGSSSPLAGKQREIKLRELQGGNWVDIGSTTIKVTNLSYTLARNPRGLYRARYWAVSGITPVTGEYDIHAKWMRGKKTIKTVKLGNANACGYVRVKRSAYPRTKYRSLKLVMYSGKYDKNKLYLRTTLRAITIYR